MSIKTKDDDARTIVNVHASTRERLKQVQEHLLKRMNTHVSQERALEYLLNDFEDAEIILTRLCGYSVGTIANIVQSASENTGSLHERLLKGIEENV